MAVTRINFIKVPLDVLPDEDIEKTILELLKKKGPQQIVFLTLWDVLRARRNREYRAILENAALCLPLSKSLVRGVKFLKLPVPIRRASFTMIIQILSVIDAHYKSLYLLGGRPQSLMEAERNVHSTFPGISIVGRFNGYYYKHMEKHILSALVKASPSLVLVGNGVPGGEKWIYRNKAKFNGGIFIKESDIIDIFSKHKKRESEKMFEKGLTFIPEVLKNPFKLFYFFRYLWYNLVTLVYRLFRT